jgi:hypothetical protein
MAKGAFMKQKALARIQYFNQEMRNRPVMVAYTCNPVYMEAYGGVSESKASPGQKVQDLAEK